MISLNRTMTYILCLGSNEQKKESLQLARERLQSIFPDIHFADEEETEPVGFIRSEKFLNQVGVFTSDLPMSEIKSTLKEIEREAGRKPEDKENGIVLLDIDLLADESMIYKPVDWDRDYVRRGIAQLAIQRRCD